MYLEKYFLVGLLTLLSSSQASRCYSSLSLAVGSQTRRARIPPAMGEGVSLISFTQNSLFTVAKLTPPLVGENPSYIAVSPPHLYCANGNILDGSITQVTFSSRLPFLTNKTVQTDRPATNHVSVLPGGRIILASNYRGSAVSSFVNKRGSFRLVDTFDVPLELAARNRDPTLSPMQQIPHPHMVLPYRQGVIAPDLGSDLVWYLRVSSKTGKLSEISRLFLEPGDGPRHAALHPRTETIYVINELSLTFVVLRPRVCGAADISVCDRRELLDDKSGLEGASAAAIRVSADGRFLYASVRPRSAPGKIVGFKLNPHTGDVKGKLGEWSSHGERPRDFYIVENIRLGRKCTSILAIVNRDSNNLVFVERNVVTGKLAANAAYNLTVKTPMSVVPY